MCGGVVEQIEKAVVQPIGKGLSEVDKFVNREIPGGWITVGLTAAGAAAYTYAADAAIAAGATVAEAEAAGAAAAAAAEGTAGADVFGGLAGTGGAAEGLTSAEQAAQVLGNLETQSGFYGGAAAPQATILPGELGDIILDANGNIVTSSGSDILAGDTGLSISPMQAIRGLNAARGLLGGGQQQQAPQLPSMGGTRQTMPQGAVDYSGLYNLLALQRARNPNSLLG